MYAASSSPSVGDDALADGVQLVAERLELLGGEAWRGLVVCRRWWSWCLPVVARSGSEVDDAVADGRADADPDVLVGQRGLLAGERRCARCPRSCGEMQEKQMPIRQPNSGRQARAPRPARAARRRCSAASCPDRLKRDVALGGASRADGAWRLEVLDAQARRRRRTPRGRPRSSAPGRRPRWRCRGSRAPAARASAGVTGSGRRARGAAGAGRCRWPRAADRRRARRRRSGRSGLCA